MGAFIYPLLPVLIRMDISRHSPADIAAGLAYGGRRDAARRSRVMVADCLQATMLKTGKTRSYVGVSTLGHTLWDQLSSRHPLWAHPYSSLANRLAISQYTQTQVGRR